MQCHSKCTVFSVNSVAFVEVYLSCACLGLVCVIFTTNQAVKLVFFYLGLDENI